MAKKGKKKPLDEKVKAKAAKKADKQALKKARSKKVKKKAKEPETVVLLTELAEPENAAIEEPLEDAELTEAAAEILASAPEQRPSAFPPAREGEPWKAVSLKMPVSHIAVVDEAAKAYGEKGISRSEFIRLALDDFIMQQQ